MCLKFKRREGSLGSAPRNWIDRQLPSCPFCRVRPVDWEVARELRMTAFDRYHFRCPICRAEISTPTINVLPVVPRKIADGIGVSKGLVIESVGMSGSELGTGNEISPDDLRMMLH